ncbi:MAG: hypothetical protein KAR13_09355, partial [Desulfobulbaceae bacterium]|nr:hypothetical protein [Desulfobulbaceae bacterium]
SALGVRRSRSDCYAFWVLFTTPSIIGLFFLAESDDLFFSRSGAGYCENAPFHLRQVQLLK